MDDDFDLIGGDPDRVLARLSAAPARRIFGTGTLLFLGALLLWLGFRTGGSLGWQAALVLLGLGALWVGTVMWRSSALVLELTGTHLRESGGRVLTLVTEVEGVERGTFAFKPSNGFLIVTTVPGQRAFAPGLWWRVGRRIGIGGLTPSGQGKAMAEILGILVSRNKAENG